MKQITNIYILVDTSFRMQRNKEKLQAILTKYSRALNFEKGKAKLHIIGYNDKILPYFSENRLTSPLSTIRRVNS